MNWLIILLIYVLNMRSEGDLCEVEKVFFIENNFWSADQIQQQTYKGSLNKVCVGLEHKDGTSDSFNYYKTTCYSLKSTNLGYVVLKDSVIKDINSYLESSEDETILFKFNYLFIDELFETTPDGLLIFKGSIQGYITHKFLEKISEDSIILRNVEADVELEQIIKESFVSKLSIKLLSLYKFFRILEDKKEELNEIEDDVDFNFYYFENSSNCLKHLKELIKILCYLKLKDDDSSDILTAEFSNISINNTTTIRVSVFKECLKKKFSEKLIKLNDGEFDEIWENLFDECFYYLKNEMLNNRIFFPIGGEYDINYYIEQFAKLIYESAKQMREKYVAANSKFKFLYPFKMLDSLRTNLKKLPFTVMKNLCETEYIPKHFSKVLRREIKKFLNYCSVDKIFIDYYNLLDYIVSLYLGLQKNSRFPSIYVFPVTTEIFNTKIVDGIKIKPDHFNKIRQIKGFYDKEEAIIMVKDTDYFFDGVGNLYCPSVVLKKKKIKEIELIFSNKENSMRFKINKYLNI